MSFQAYLDNVEEKTGKTRTILLRKPRKKGLLSLETSLRG
jgi:hypothetical protein